VILTSLFQVLSRTRDNIAGAFKGLLRRKISPQTLDTLEEALLLADMGITTVEEILELVRKQNQKTMLESVRNHLLSLLKRPTTDQLNPQGPTVFLVVGVNGSGKTTTAAKLAHYFSQSGRKVLLIGADTYRAAAVEQLQQWSRWLNIRLVCNEQSQEPAAVVYDGLTAARASDSDIVVVDTAGRLHTYKNLMTELEKLARVIQTHFSEYTLQALITIDANLGQNSLQQARQFTRYAHLSGAILTKMDGTAKGGILFALSRELHLPVVFLGVGENAEDLVPFNASDYVNSLLGFSSE
jgi:fused signal recognition particle receptor